MHYVCDVRVSKIAGANKKLDDGAGLESISDINLKCHNKDAVRNFQWMKKTDTYFAPIFSVGNISGRQAVKALY